MRLKGEIIDNIRFSYHNSLTRNDINPQGSV